MEPATFSQDDIPWESANADGTRCATLAGTREPGVTFTYAFFLPRGFWDGPHSHGADIHLVVAAGELRLTFETPWESKTARRYAAGSFLHVPAGAVHADGARTDTVIIGTTVGPWSTKVH